MGSGRQSWGSQKKGGGGWTKNQLSSRSNRDEWEEKEGRERKKMLTLKLHLVRFYSSQRVKKKEIIKTGKKREKKKAAAEGVRHGRGMLRGR